jgi:hypothetical protein
MQLDRLHQTLQLSILHAPAPPPVLRALNTSLFWPLTFFVTFSALRDIVCWSAYGLWRHSSKTL